MEYEYYKIQSDFFDSYNIYGPTNVGVNACLPMMYSPFLEVHPEIKLIKSGKYWVTWANLQATNSVDIHQLSGTFKNNVINFLKALDDAGARYTITTTRRSPERAYLFHWCWKIALKKCKAKDATKMPGVEIEWDHGNEIESVNGAKEMVRLFGLAVPPSSKVAPSITSNHIRGEAIDIEIKWVGTIEIRLGEKVKKKGDDKEKVKYIKVSYMRDPNKNTALHEVGKSYGVIKHTGDRPHWSKNGR